MRIGHPTPLPTLEYPARGIAFIAAGTVVLCAVQGWGAILIGCGLISYGVCVLVISPTPQKAHGTRTASSRPRVPAVSESRTSGSVTPVSATGYRQRPARRSPGGYAASK